MSNMRKTVSFEMKILKKRHRKHYIERSSIAPSILIAFWKSEMLFLRNWEYKAVFFILHEKDVKLPKIFFDINIMLVILFSFSYHK